MKFCTQCGSPLEDDFTFCISCGAPVDNIDVAAGDTTEISSFSNQDGSVTVSYQQPAQETTPDVTIPYNSQPSAPGRISQPIRPDQVQASAAQKHSPIIPILATLLAVVVVAGGVCVWGFGFNGFDRLFNGDETLSEQEVSDIPESQEQSQSDTTENTSSSQDSNTTEINVPSASTQSQHGTYTGSNPYLKANYNNDYVLPNSSLSYLSESDLWNLSEDELRIARNEIAARHGRAFKDANLREYFESKSWYRQTLSAEEYDANTGYYLNDIEMANSNLIRDYENAHGYNQ